jgi:hypothetical protein
MTWEKTHTTAPRKTAFSYAGCKGNAASATSSHGCAPCDAWSRASKAMKFADEPQSFLERFVEPVDGPTHTLHVHFEEYAPGGRRHGHVNEAAFYIFEGRRYEVHDGVRYDWQAGT